MDSRQRQIGDSALGAAHDGGPAFEQGGRCGVVAGLGPDVGDGLGRVGEDQRPAPIGLQHPHAVGGVEGARSRFLHDGAHHDTFGRPRCGHRAAAEVAARDACVDLGQVELGAGDETD